MNPLTVLLSGAGAPAGHVQRLSSALAAVRRGLQTRRTQTKSRRPQAGTGTGRGSGSGAVAQLTCR